MKVEMNNNQGRYVEEIATQSEKRVESQSVKVDRNETPKTQEATEKENQKVREIAEKLNKELEMVDTSIEFKVHETSGIGLNKVSIKVVEKESEKVIVEIPSEEAIEMAEKMEEITGMLFDHSR